MAKIIKTSAQEDALKKINTNIKLLVGVNSVLNCKTEKGSMMMAFGKAKASIPMSKSDSDEMLTAIRKKLTSEVKALSKKYAIVLDEEDEAVLSNREEETVKETEKTPEVVNENPGAGDASDSGESTSKASEDQDGVNEPDYVDDDDYADEAETADTENGRTFY